MRHRFLGLMGPTVTLVAVMSLMSNSVAGQAPPAAQTPADAGTYVASRTPDGQPDISGMWLPGQVGGVETPSGEPWRGQRTGNATEFLFGITARPETRAAAGEAPAPPRIMVVDPPDGKIPLQPWAAAKRTEIIANQDKVEYLDGRVLCLPSGIPRQNSPILYNSYQFLQKPGYVVMLYEYDHNYRIIPLDGRPHLNPNVRLGLGVLHGHWEGNTLVVDVTNFSTDLPNNNWVTGLGQPPWGAPASALTSGHGVIHSDVLHVIERFTRVDADTIRYEATIEDPKVFTRPWKIAYDAFKRAPPDHQLFEYACHEGEKSIVLMTGVDRDKVYQEMLSLK